MTSLKQHKTWKRRTIGQHRVVTLGTIKKQRNFATNVSALHRTAMEQYTWACIFPYTVSILQRFFNIRSTHFASLVLQLLHIGTQPFVFTKTISSQPSIYMELVGAEMPFAIIYAMGACTMLQAILLQFKCIESLSKFIMTMGVSKIADRGCMN